MVKVRLLEAPPPGAGLTTVTAAVPGVAMSEAGTVAVNSVCETKVVVSGLPFQSTVELERKALPLTTRVKAGPPVPVLLGLMIESTGAGLSMVKVSALEVVAFWTTVTLAVPAVAMSEAGTDACNSASDTNVVVSAAPFQSTTAPGSKLLPLTVRVKLEPPAVAEEGDRLESVASGADSTKIVPSLSAPPNPPRP